MFDRETENCLKLKNRSQKFKRKAESCDELESSLNPCKRRKYDCDIKHETEYAEFDILKDLSCQEICKLKVKYQNTALISTKSKNELKPHIPLIGSYIVGFQKKCSSEFLWKFPMYLWNMFKYKYADFTTLLSYVYCMYFKMFKMIGKNTAIPNSFMRLFRYLNVNFKESPSVADDVNTFLSVMKPLIFNNENNAVLPLHDVLDIKTRMNMIFSEGSNIPIKKWFCNIDLMIRIILKCTGNDPISLKQSTIAQYFSNSVLSLKLQAFLHDQNSGYNLIISEAQNLSLKVFTLESQNVNHSTVKEILDLILLIMKMEKYKSILNAYPFRTRYKCVDTHKMLREVANLVMQVSKASSNATMSKSFACLGENKINSYENKKTFLPNISWNINTTVYNESYFQRIMRLQKDNSLNVSQSKQKSKSENNLKCKKRQTDTGELNVPKRCKILDDCIQRANESKLLKLKLNTVSNTNINNVEKFRKRYTSKKDKSRNKTGSLVSFPVPRDPVDAEISKILDHLPPLEEALKVSQVPDVNYFGDPTETIYYDLDNGKSFVIFPYVNIF